MKKYTASTPNAEVIGTALLAYDNSIEYEEFKSILAEYQLLEIDPARWYPQQLTLDIQRTIKAQPGSSLTLVSIGMQIINTAVFPTMNSLEDAVNAFASSYPMNFRHQSPDDMIRAALCGPGHIQVTNGSPHADEMIYGYVYALVNRFKPEGSIPVVQFADLNAVDGDGDTIIDVMY